MDLSKKLLEEGWHITEDGFKKVIAAVASTGGTGVNDVRKIVSTIIDMDFRDVAGGALPLKRDDTIPGRIVLQLQKTRNISAPKSNEDSKVAPRFLQLELSDGQTTIQALELENIPALNMDLPPGTKLYFRSDRIQLMQGFLILRSTELQVLGGRVEPMVEKWELARTMQKYARSGRRMSGATGPPPWIQFGKKLDTSIANDRNFKSLRAAASDGKDTKENEEFNAMRSEAIAEASKAGAKKVFGGGGQQMLDHNVKKILEKGYSEEDAKQALRSTNNNLERALYNLKRRGEVKRIDDSGMGTKNSTGGTLAPTKNNRGAPTREMGSGKRGGSSAKEEVVSKPAGNVSLFDFLTDKLPVEAISDTAATVTTTTTTAVHTISASNVPNNSFKSCKIEKSKREIVKNSINTNTESTMDSDSNCTRPRFENNMSSSFAANRSSGPINSRQRNERGGGNSRGGANNRGGRNSNERGQSTIHFNPFRDNANNQNQNLGRNSRLSYERAKSTNPFNKDIQDNGASDYTNKGASDRTHQQQRNHGGEERSNTQNENKNRFTNKRDGHNRQQNSNNDNKNSGVMKNTVTRHSNRNDASVVNKLTEATSKIKLSDTRRSISGEDNIQYSQNASQNYVAAQLPNQFQNPTQHPNGGYSYDTSKIIGFQNKETNEFALTLLKSEGMGQQKEQQSVSPKTNNKGSQQNLQIPNDNNISTLSHLQQAPSPMGGYAAHTNDYSMPNQSTISNVGPIPSHFGMVQGDGWHWKIGDLCFAKYWDDGRYYEAEVTAVSDKTCVVFYLGYGNHEEVLKTDCLPITDSNHYPINNFNGAISYLQPQQVKSVPSTHPIQQIQVGNYQRGGGGSQRFRERQMYVPPHKREN